MEKDTKDKTKIINQSISEIMQRSYLDYAMSVIVSRALPDVRDGLKPVHRRILYSMHRLGLSSDSRFRKSAMVVGDVLGKYHPHSDTSVYDALARMAQEFSLRYPLIRGQGNFGSLDGDRPAAMRYTEAKLEKITSHLLEEIDKETVKWVPNYDNTRKEPHVLPAKYPNLLLTGSVGIAVGMATNIPPHNITEVINATLAITDNPKISPQELSEIVPGPDFPTGGIIYDKKAIAEAYSQGRGGFVCRAKAEIEETPDGRGYRIIVSEIIWQVNKSTLVERMADLVKSKKLVGIRNIRDESNREGVRIVIELKKGFQPKRILNKLYKYTDLQKTYHLNLLALVDGIQPQVLSLKEILEKFIEHRLIVIRKRSEFELREAEARAHILEGFSKAIKNIDEVIETIKKSKDKNVARINLIKKFKFSEIQAEAILKMRLQALSGLERKKIEDELKEKIKLIESLKTLIGSPIEMKKLMREELEDLIKKHGDKRRTKVVTRAVKEVGEDELVQEKDVVVTITQGGYIQRSPIEAYKQQKRAGQGVSGITTKEEDVVKHFLFASTTDKLLFFTDKGKVLSLKAYEIPETNRASKGKPIVNVIELDGSEKVTAALVLKKSVLEDKEDKYIVMATRGGIIKKTPIKDFANIRHSGIRAIKLKQDDVLGWVGIGSDSDEAFIVTQDGQSIRFAGKEVRSMGRNSSGVIAIRLKGEDIVKQMKVIKKDDKKTLVLISEKGLGKKTNVNKFRPQKRSGSGIKAMKVTPRTGVVAGALLVGDEETLIIISKHGKVIRMSFKNIPTLGRNTQGVRVMKLKAGDSVADFIAF